MRTNLIFRSAVWLGPLGWWLYLRLPAGASLLDVRAGVPLLAGAILVSLGVTVFIWSALALARAAPTALALTTVLLVRGPYQYVRNPLYLAAAAVFAGVSTLYAPWVRRDLITVVVVAILVHVFVVWREEPRTRKRLGSAYDDYCAKVPRWIPTAGG